MSTSVVVIGGGIVGAAVALRCAEQGATVTLLDCGVIEQNATRASFAWLNANNKTPLEYYALNVAGMQAYANLGDAFKALTATRSAGNTEWATSDAGVHALREKVDRLRRWGYSAELLPITELERLEPTLIPPGTVEEFAWFPDEGYVEQVALKSRMLELAERAGATVSPTNMVRRLDIHHGRVRSVETAEGEVFSPDVVAVCAGSSTARLLATADLELPMAPAVGMVALTEPVSTPLRSVHHDETMHIRPSAGGRLLIRHTDFDGVVNPSEQVPTLTLDELKARVASVLPEVGKAGIEWARVAVRPIPADGFPAVGFWPGVENLYVVVTHSGVTLGPLLGRLASTEILRETRAGELESFRPGRFAGKA